MKPHQNVTLSLPESLLRRFRVFAATRNESMTSLMAEAIENMMDQQRHTTAANRRFLKRIQNAPDRSLGDEIRWTREEIHER